MFLWILIGIASLMILFTIVSWWRDEQQTMGRRDVPPPPMQNLLGAVPALSAATVRHPSIDPYVSELREYLLQPPLPQGPGEMAERVYQHLTQWVNEHLTEDALHTANLYGLEDELLVDSTQRFVDISRNEPATMEGIE